MKKLLPLFVLTVLGGCASGGNVKEEMPLAQKFGKGTKAVVSVVSESTVEHSSEYANQLQGYITEELTDKKVAVIPKGGKADWAVVVKFTKIDRPSAGKSLLMGSYANAYIEAKASFVAPGSMKIGEIFVTGNSETRGRSSIGGFGTTSTNDYVKEGLKNISRQIASYVEKNSQ